ncbi:hypothetical protein HG15A2_42770 [Adhaeretor mobilis]|uniref:Uncharacterized protein n=2 Tax=Adhaeretor mobilis TaxID=1930276 RepID=A0A517N1D1_9BACT|nr:hypothetical protein HG15A2_42770 [Adhaeretor mobilis]
MLGFSLSTAYGEPADRKSSAVEIPKTRTLVWQESSELTNKILEYWADHPLGDWKSEGKMRVPRALMGRFALRRDLDAANAYLLQVKPWGNVGSTWSKHPEGDYDFTLAGLVPILFLFGEDPNVLFPETRTHLLNVLMTEDGGDPLVTVPRTMGLVRDTENHLLMTEGSRFLKNRWMALHGSEDPRFDNTTNGLELWLLDMLENLRMEGLYEFNSIPYQGYTLTALLNLEAFGSPRIRRSARRVLDQLNWKYAIGSLSLRRFPPFRRQYRHATTTSLDGDYHTALMKTWMSLSPDSPANLEVHAGGLHHALWACWAPYRLPDKTAKWILTKPEEFYVRIGHGPGASPEIYSGGPGYLLSAGGVHRGMMSQIVSRPITLLLDDGATDLSEVLYLAGPGTAYRGWNNTGVWRNLAVAGGPVQIPQSWTPDATGPNWRVFHRGENLCVAVHSRPDLGIVYVSRSDDAQIVAKTLEETNGDATQLGESFLTPGGQRISFDVNAKQDQWVFFSLNQEPLDREFDTWPSLSDE